MNRLSWLKDFGIFLCTHRRWWLVPLLIVIVVLTLLLFFAGGPALSPFLYGH